MRYTNSLPLLPPRLCVLSPIFCGCLRVCVRTTIPTEPDQYQLNGHTIYYTVHHPRRDRLYCLYRLDQYRAHLQITELHTTSGLNGFRRFGSISLQSSTFVCEQRCRWRKIRWRSIVRARAPSKSHLMLPEVNRHWTRHGNRAIEIGWANRDRQIEREENVKTPNSTIVMLSQREACAIAQN